MMRWAKTLGRRLLAIGLLCAVTAGFVVVGQVIWAEHRSIEARIEEGRVLLGRLEAAAVVARVSPGDTAAPVDTADVMIAEESEGLAIAALQARLSDLASAAGLRVESSGGLPSRDEGPLKLIGLRIEVSGKDAAVGKMLHSIETVRPVLLIEGARIRGGQMEPEPQVEANLDVYAAFEPKPGEQP